jgi:hypothetical protein
MMLPDGEGGTYVLTAEQIGYPGRGGILWPVQFFVHRRTAVGDPAPGWTSRGVLVSTPVIDHTFEVRHLPTMVADGRGGVLVGWVYYFSTEFPNPPLKVQRISRSGARMWGEDGILVHAGPGVCTLPTLLADDAGGAFVFWGQWDAPRVSLRVFGQHLTPSGQPLWPIDGRPVSSSSFDRLDQAAPADGGWVRQFYAPAIAATSDGANGAILGWAASTGADLNVYATRVAQDGSLSWPGDRLLCEAASEQASVTCVGAGAVGAVFAWRDGRAGEDVSLRAQFISRHGRTRWIQDGALVAEGPGNRGPISLVSAGPDDYYFAWCDPRVGGQIFAQRILGNGHRSPTWPRNGARVGTTASGDPTTSSQAVRPVRAGGGTAIAGWSDLAEGGLAMLLTPHGPAQGPAPTSLAPMLSAFSGPPAKGTFALLNVSPNPTVGAATLRFLLPEAAEASLELFDLAGRRLWSSDVSALGAGTDTWSRSRTAFPASTLCGSLKACARPRRVVVPD